MELKVDEGPISGPVYYLFWFISILLLVLSGYTLYINYVSITEQKESTVEGFNPFKLIMGFIKLVPILISVFSRLDKVFDAFFNAAMGLIYSVINTIITSTFIFTDTFYYVVTLAKFTFLSIVCTLENIGKLHHCIWFYILDFIVYLVSITFMSFLEFLDDTFQIQRTGFTLVGLVEYFFDLAESADSLLHSYTGAHIIHYPDSLISYCYKCSNPPNTVEMNARSKIMRHDVFVKLPELAWEPLEYFINAGMDLADVFSGIG